MKTLSFCILACLILVGISSGNTINVPSQEPTIQAGIDAAVSGDTVLVADGTYTGDGNRDIDFGGKGVVLKSENGSDFTIIDCQGTESDPHRGLYFHSGEDSTAIVRGFTITNGIAPREGPIIIGWWWGGYGGAIKCDSGSSPTITDNVICGNWAFHGCGGAIYCDGGSSPTIENNKVFGNWATYGGGIAVWNSSPIIKSNHIDSNRAYCNIIMSDCDGGDGGGLYCVNSAPNIIGNIFTRNVAKWGIYGGGMGFGAAIYSDSSCQLEIHNNTITDNKWLDPGHGFSGGVVSLNGAEANLTQNIIAFNKGEGLGGIDTSRVIVSCCDIYGNTDGDWTGGAEELIYVYGNVSLDPLFCDTAASDFQIHNSSPCAPANNSCGSLIGALGVGCTQTGIDDDNEQELPLDFSLQQNYPNPFNSVTEIGFSLSEATHIKLEVYNVMGQRVTTLIDRHLQAGEHTVIWDSKESATGVYLYRLEAGAFVETKKMLLLK